jgi:hypothetical protein
MVVISVTINDRNGTLIDYDRIFLLCMFVFVRTAYKTDLSVLLYVYTVTCFVTEDSVRIVNWFIQQRTNRTYNYL